MQSPFQPTQENLSNWFQFSIGLPETFATVLVAIIGIVVIVSFAFAIDRMVGWMIGSLGPRLVDKFGATNGTRWLVAFRKQFVARRSAHVIATLMVYWLIPLALEGFPGTLAVVRNLIEGYIVIVIVIAINSLIRVGDDVLLDKDLPSGVSLGFASQAAQVLVWVVGMVVVASVVFDTSVTVLLSGMAGMTAVLLLVFKDSILGFVAGIQLASNDMLRIDDWIEVPQYGANGNVTDIGLTSVKVQNFDKTISTVPTYALVSESFRNWRGMEDSGARRILRAIPIDMDGIGFLTDEQFDRLHKVSLLRPYLDERRREIETFNQQFSETERVSPNTRHLTNIGVFRVYLERYLAKHPDLRDDMTLIVQQLAPSRDGLPIQIVVFTQLLGAVEYERVQADLFDHIIARSCQSLA